MDAEPTPPATGAREVPARHTEAWVHVDGAWRRGWVHHWYRVDGRWAAWMQHDRTVGEPWPHFEGYFYDPRVIVRRVHGQPPPPD